MMSVYHRRFYPADVDATVAYVAPQDVVNEQDSYVGFVQQAGSDPKCNEALRTVQWNALHRRASMVAKLTKLGLHYEQTFGLADRAFEAAVLDTPFAFWQYRTQASCLSRRTSIKRLRNSTGRDGGRRPLAEVLRRALLQAWLRVSVNGEPLGDGLPGLVDPGLHRAQRDVELVGDLGVRERAEVAQDQRLDELRMARLQALQGLQQVQP